SGPAALRAPPKDHAPAPAGEPNEGAWGNASGRGRENPPNLGTRRIGILRPAGSLADIRVCDVRVAGEFREQRRLLGAAYDQRLTAGRRRAEFLQFRPAKLARGRDFGAATAALHGRAVERHRVFTRADQNLWRPIGHFVSGYM